MKKTKINVFNTYIKSITDFNSYVSFFKLSLGKAFLYLVFLSIFLGCISAINPIISFNNFLDDAKHDYKKEAPEFTFKDGKLDVKSKGLLTYGESDNKFFVDTTGKTKSSILKNENGLLITNDSIYQKDFHGNISKFPLSTLNGITFNKADIQKVLPRLKYLDVFILIFFLIKFFINYLIDALILSVVGMLLKNILRMNLKFKEIYKLSIYALTLPTTFNIVVLAINKPLDSISPYIFPIVFGVGCIYLIKALTVIKINEAQL